jgi:hypothetical protein
MAARKIYVVAHMYYTLVHNIWQCAFTNTMNFGTIPPIQVVTVVQIDEPPNTGYSCDNQKKIVRNQGLKKYVSLPIISLSIVR